MIEYKFILPHADNDGENLGQLHSDIQDKLAHVFGGFTCWDALGGWRSDATQCTIMERVRVYSVAVESDLFEGTTPLLWFRNYARTLCREAKQEAVYIQKGPIVEIIKNEQS